MNFLQSYGSFEYSGLHAKVGFIGSALLKERMTRKYLVRQIGVGVLCLIANIIGNSLVGKCHIGILVMTLCPCVRLALV